MKLHWELSGHKHSNLTPEYNFEVVCKPLPSGLSPSDINCMCLSAHAQIPLKSSSRYSAWSLPSPPRPQPANRSHYSWRGNVQNGLHKARTDQLVLQTCGCHGATQTPLHEGKWKWWYPPLFDNTQHQRKLSARSWWHHILCETLSGFPSLQLVNLIRGVVEGKGFVRPAQALVFLECFCDVTPHCLHFMKLLELHFSKATRQCLGRKVWIPGYLQRHRQVSGVSGNPPGTCYREFELRPTHGLSCFSWLNVLVAVLLTFCCWIHCDNTRHCTYRITMVSYTELVQYVITERSISISIYIYIYTEREIWENSLLKFLPMPLTPTTELRFKTLL